MASIGKSIKRKEDLRFLVGKGTYIDDIELPRMLHAAILRSPYAHARINEVDVKGALEYQGVIDVLTGKDVAEMSNPAMQMNFKLKTQNAYCMAVDKVRFVGEPIAALVAVDRYIANDALDSIDVIYEPLPVVVDPEEAMKSGAPLVHEEAGDNTAYHDLFHYGDVEKAFKEADHIVKERFKYHSYTSTPIETNGVISDYDSARGTLTIWANFQLGGMLHRTLSDLLKIPENKFRLITPDIGGGFGNKCNIFHMLLIGLLSIKTGRPVKWIEDRRENFIGNMRGSDRIFESEAAVKKDGTIQAIKTKLIDNVGAYLRFPEPIGIIRAFQTVLGCYKIKNLLMDLYAVNTNTLPTGPNRGYGCQSFYFQLERLVDSIGKKLGLDPVEIRKRNFIQPQEFPYTTAVGCVYDSGNFPETLRKALEMADYEKMRKEQERLRKEGKYIGIGISTIVEPAASNMAEFFIVTETLPLSGATEAAKVKVEPSGKITAAVGSCPQGQGHETIVAQIVADEFAVNTDDVYVLPGFDSSTHPWTTGSGTWGSRFCAVGPDAVILACRKVKEKIFKIAAHILHDKPENFEMKDGMVQVKGIPQKALPLEAVSGIAYFHTLILPPDMEPGLEAAHVFNFPTVNMPDDKRRINLATTYGNSAHIAVVEVEIETGQVKILRYVVVSDCGKMINPMTVDGQIHGGVLHGIGGGLQEELIYDDDGQLLNATFMDYLVPTAVESPNIEVGHMETPSPFNILGTKGMGEGGAIPTPAVLASAVEDALTPFGIKITEVPLKPEKIQKSIKSK